MTDLRWELADRPKAQGQLFDEPVFEREPGRGEFRGIEFLHVRAHRIINEVRGAPFGFRYTINAYRGCTHACSYCLWGETPILLADGRTKPLAEIRPGDTVYGTVRRGAYRRYTPTTVLDHWSTVRTAYRVTLADGTELIASGDHRFLTERGWRHVAGAGAGAARRPHLTTGTSLFGVGALADPPKAGADYRRGYLCGLTGGRGPLGPYPNELPPLDDEARHRANDYLDEGERITAWPALRSDDWCKGFLAGAFDAEGGYGRGVLRISATDDAVVARAEECLRRFDFRYTDEPPRRASRRRHLRLPGGLRQHLRFFHTVDPATTHKRTIDGSAIKSDARLRVVAVEPLGLDLPMFDITTGTGDFIANGVVSHNCFARPSHTYLDLDADRDFERRIVVKTNAVPLLRSELDPRRWAGDSIAMGTNTDPYQRAEGKYRLTRGVVEVLAEAGNPFSILTKSTLVVRDVALLAEAARRSDVRVNLSIGTLDEDVWRATEPGTPHPLRRIRAVERLNAAGVPCGVLMAPVLPDLSDAPEQLDAVVRACVGAGARSITPVLLHLRPGVKDVYLDRLAGTHPELVDTVRRRYRNRVYAPRADQEALNALVQDLVRQHGGTTSDAPMPRTGRRGSRSAGSPPASDGASPAGDAAPADEPAQLSLL